MTLSQPTLCGLFCTCTDVIHDTCNQVLSRQQRQRAAQKKPHRVATVGFCLFKPQLACASVRLESLGQLQTAGVAIAGVANAQVDVGSLAQVVDSRNCSAAVPSSNGAAGVAISVFCVVQTQSQSANRSSHNQFRLLVGIGTSLDLSDAEVIADNVAATLVRGTVAVGS